MKKFIEESWLVIALGVVFAVMLAGAQSGLIGRIKVNQAAALETAISDVVPGTASSEDVPTTDLDVGKEVHIYKCLDADGKLVGWAIDTTGPGFIDKIRVVAGLSPDLSKIYAMTALEQLETPGLGNKIKGPWANQFRNKSANEPLKVVKGNPGAANEIQAITGATYSSTYVTDIINNITQKIRPELAKTME